MSTKQKPRELLDLSELLHFFSLPFFPFFLLSFLERAADGQRGQQCWKAE